jgi:hypothetical protein
MKIKQSAMFVLALVVLAFLANSAILHLFSRDSGFKVAEQIARSSPEFQSRFGLNARMQPARKLTVNRDLADESFTEFTFQVEKDDQDEGARVEVRVYGKVINSDAKFDVEIK